MIEGQVRTFQIIWLETGRALIYFCLWQAISRLYSQEEAKSSMGASYEKYQWNYKVLKEPIPSSEGEILELEKKLSDLGSRYWEVVAVNPMNHSPNMLIYMKSTKWRTVVSKD